MNLNIYGAFFKGVLVGLVIIFIVFACFG